MSTSSQPKEISPWFVVRLMGELGFVIAIPLVILLLVGIYLDSRFNTQIIFTILGILTALSFSTYAIFKKIQKIQQ